MGALNIVAFSIIYLAFSFLIMDIIIRISGRLIFRIALIIGIIRIVIGPRHLSNAVF